MSNTNELDITELFDSICPRDYSASVAEIGNNAGQDTWNAACEDAADYNLLDNDEKRETFREYVKGFGAWTDEEIHAWTDNELNALLLQMISGDMRESGLDQRPVDWAEYQRDCESGQCSSRIFGGPMSTDGRVYYCIED